MNNLPKVINAKNGTSCGPLFRLDSEIAFAFLGGYGQGGWDTTPAAYGGGYDYSAYGQPAAGPYGQPDPYAQQYNPGMKSLLFVICSFYFLHYLSNQRCGTWMELILYSISSRICSVTCAFTYKQLCCL